MFNVTVVRTASPPSTYEVKDGTTLAGLFEGKSIEKGSSLYVNGVAETSMDRKLVAGDTILVVGRVYNG